MGVPLIAPTVSDPYLQNYHWSPTLARLSPTNKLQATALVDLIQYFGWKRVSLIYNNDPYGTDYYQLGIVHITTMKRYTSAFFHALRLK